MRTHGTEPPGSCDLLYEKRPGTFHCAGCDSPLFEGKVKFEGVSMDKLMKLPPEMKVHPGHTDPTTIGDEWERNPFVRVWRGLDEEGDERCTVQGQSARLVLWGPDYDGGHKAWVRWPDGADDIVPGSKVER